MERCGAGSQSALVRRNIGADLVLVRGPDPGTRSYCQEKGRSLFEGIAFSPGGGTSLFLIDDTPVMLLPSHGQELLGAELLPLQSLVRQMTRKDDSVPVRGTMSVPISSHPDHDEVKFLRAGADGTMTMIDAVTGQSDAYQYYLVMPAGSPTLSPGDQAPAGLANRRPLPPISCPLGSRCHGTPCRSVPSCPCPGRPDGTIGTWCSLSCGNGSPPG